MEKGGVSKRLINLASALVGNIPGGMAVVCFLASAFFGAISGSSTATVIAIGSIMVPGMLQAGYDMKFSLATVAAAGYLGTIIPPSIPMVTYGVASGASIGDVFLAGFIPGFMLVAIMSIYGVYYGRKNKMEVYEPFSIKNVLVTAKDAIWAIFMPIIILGGIYGGIFTPTEAAAVAVVYALIVGLFIYKELDLKSIIDIMKEAVVSSSMIMFIVAAAAAFGFVMTREMIPTRIAEAILNFSDSKIVILLLINLLLLVVGTFMETNAAILLLAPMLVPIMNQLDVNLVHFGIVMIVNLSIGMVTPPLGVNLFVAARLRKEPVDTVINKHLIFYIVLSLGGLLLLTFIPGISLLLVN